MAGKDVGCDLQIIQERLDRLRRNEQQMSDEQRQKYARQLESYREKIRGECHGIFREYAFMNYFVLDGDTRGLEDLRKRAGKIIHSEWWQEHERKAYQMLFRTYSLDSFIEAVFRMRLKLVCDAYAFYWVECIRVNASTGAVESRIIDAIWGKGYSWNSEHGQWERHDKKTGLVSCAAMLPPTMELIREAYRGYEDG